MSPRSSRTTHYVGACLMAALGVFALSSVGCFFPPGSLPEFPGLYNVTRGQAELTITWAIGPESGEFNHVASGGQFEPIDPNELPDGLQQFAEDWNAGLEEFNEGIDAVFADQVEISHPHPWAVRLTNPDDPNLGFHGLNGPDGFIALALGFQLGTVDASAVIGQWDGQDTVTGEWSVGWAFADATVPGGLGTYASVSAVIPYEAVLVPED
jgi:hypothetical protein